MLRTEQIAVGSYIHVISRGVRHIPIYRQQSDLPRLRFGLYYLNSVDVPDNWMRQLHKKETPDSLEWSERWGKREPLVSILAYTIMPNHIHMVLKEIREGGISKFMHKFCMSYSKYMNAKYEESGSLFQGRFKSVVAEDDAYLRYLAVYVMVKNTFEMYPGGIKKAMENFNAAYRWAVAYPFSSLADYANEDASPIVEKDIFGELFETPLEFKSFARECMKHRQEILEEQFHD